MDHEHQNNESMLRPWINPMGGFGDMLMLSGVLKLVVDASPSRRFNLIRRTNYLSILKGHPAIASVGFPPKGARIFGVDYWAKEKLGPGLHRPFQILARTFGLSTPVEEKLFLPDEQVEDRLLQDFIPWKDVNILIAPASDSPRKTMPPAVWHRLVDYLLSNGTLVMQAGRLHDLHIRNTYSLLGLTTPRQLVALIRKCDLVITLDNFIMHAAHLAGKPAVVIWGATHHGIYGYPEHVHIQMRKTCELQEDDECIGPGNSEGGKLYGTTCPLGERGCMNQVSPAMIFEAVKCQLSKGGPLVKVSRATLFPTAGPN